MPRSRCSSLSCHTVLPEHEHTVLSSVDERDQHGFTPKSNPRGLGQIGKALTIPYTCAPCDHAHERVRVIFVKLRNVTSVRGDVVRSCSPFHPAVLRPQYSVRSSPRCESACRGRLHPRHLSLPRLYQRCLDKAFLLSWLAGLPTRPLLIQAPLICLRFLEQWRGKFLETVPECSSPRWSYLALPQPFAPIHALCSRHD
jgi:hypothetical protein